MRNMVKTQQFGRLLAIAALVALPLAAVSARNASAQAVEVGETYGAPPAIPEYDQPASPGDGYIWTPGYWAWDTSANDYYWVDGAWVEPPYTGALWTPGWWGPGYDNGYLWNAGYWGPNVGYYGGLNYGFGYFGVGYYGGYWNGGHFWYNRGLNHFGPGFGGHFYNGGYGGFRGSIRGGGYAFNRTPPSGFNRGGFNGG